MCLPTSQCGKCQWSHTLHCLFTQYNSLQGLSPPIPLPTCPITPPLTSPKHYPWPTITQPLSDPNTSPLIMVVYRRGCGMKLNSVITGKAAVKPPKYCGVRVPKYIYTYIYIYRKREYLYIYI